MEVTKDLEAKTDTIEAELYKHYKEVQEWRRRLNQKDDEIAVLKKVVKDNNAEALKMMNDQNHLKKVIKTKEKDIYTLESSKQNQLSTIKNLKESSTKVKEEKSRLEKEAKKIHKKKTKLETRTSQNPENNNIPIIKSHLTSISSTSFSTTSSTIFEAAPLSPSFTPSSSNSTPIVMGSISSPWNLQHTLSISNSSKIQSTSSIYSYTTSNMQISPSISTTNSLQVTPPPSPPTTSSLFHTSQPQAT